jgi:hypothetical protein
VQAVKRQAVWEEDCAKAASEVEKAVLEVDGEAGWAVGTGHWLCSFFVYISLLLSWKSPVSIS